MNSCDVLSPVSGCDMITWQTSNSANLAQLFKRLHTLCFHYHIMRMDFFIRLMEIVTANKNRNYMLMQTTNHN